MIIRANFIKNDSVYKGGQLYRVYFWIEGNKFFWDKWFMPEDIILVDEGYLEITDRCFDRFRLSLQLNHSIPKVRYMLQCQPTSVEWEEPI